MQKKINKKNHDRLAQALRSNLLKRKEQQRSRVNGSTHLQQDSLFFRQTDQGLFVNVRLIPNAKDDIIRGIYFSPEGQSYLKVSVKAIPENGQANDALICFMASELHFPKTHITLVKGEKSQLKTLLLQGNENDALSQKLKSLIN